MRIRLLAISNKLPHWVVQGFGEYVKRLPPSYPFELIEIPAEKRTKNYNSNTIIRLESEKLLAASKPQHRRIVLDIKGQSWSTQKLSRNLEIWHIDSWPIDLLIGGPDGLSETCLNQAEFRWSLSPLTLPHPLVRIIVIEQLYRAISILQNHPYHR